MGITLRQPIALCLDCRQICWEIRSHPYAALRDIDVEPRRRNVPVRRPSVMQRQRVRDTGCWSLLASWHSHRPCRSWSLQPPTPQFRYCRKVARCHSVYKSRGGIDALGEVQSIYLTFRWTNYACGSDSPLCVYFRVAPFSPRHGRTGTTGIVTVTGPAAHRGNKPYITMDVLARICRELSTEHPNPKGTACTWYKYSSPCKSSYEESWAVVIAGARFSLHPRRKEVGKHFNRHSVSLGNGVSPNGVRSLVLSVPRTSQGFLSDPCPETRT